ncbi:MAG: glycyl-tRNA synthetase beta chain [Arenicella sp.]|jgi:glycyl-tRNA synthetase beta chain
MTDTLLIELGTEELPPKTLKKLSDAFTAELLNGLRDAELISQADADLASPFASPRRLALVLPNVIAAQPDQTIERRGPAVQAAFKEDGQATSAAIGFAKSCGVDIGDLERLKTDKGEWLSYNIKQAGKSLSALLPAIIDQAIKRLPIAKRMRWGNGTAEFVRPVKWLIVMHGEQVLPATILDIDSGNTTRGHRFHSEGEIVINNANNYQQRLLEQGHVMADFNQRQAMILHQVKAAAASVNGAIEDDQALLDEVTGLVEYPTAVVGDFDQSFLEVPQECLISSMRDHQKYFHVVDQSGKLMPHFITVSNIESKNPDQVRSGNEKVLRARLSDAQFFWLTDQKIKLADRVQLLSKVMFHAKLGSVLEKAQRIQQLAGKLASKMGGDPALAERGALLAKADLVSDMVGEFDELQGVMGHYYADRDGEPALIGECIEQHYWPKFAGDRLPISAEAQAVALADKLDSLVGIYASGEVPTGDKDPYALRRASLSILRILIEQERPFKLSELVAESVAVYSLKQKIEINTETQIAIVGFIRGRLTAFYQSQNIATNTINAVLACEPDSPLDFEQRVKAVSAFTQLAEATDLAAANKRISNILKKQQSDVTSEVDESLLTETAEQELYSAIQHIESDCISLFDHGDYPQGLEKLASLRTPVDNFFEHVMVMSDNDDEKKNRLALLKRMQSLFLRVADIALLQA